MQTLAKSLHTVSAVSSLAAFIHSQRAMAATDRGAAVHCVSVALAILGHGVPADGDPCRVTYDRCIDATLRAFRDARREFEHKMIAARGNVE